MRRLRRTGVPVALAFASGIGAGAVAGLVNLVLRAAFHSRLPPVEGTAGSCVVAGAAAGLLYAAWTRISPRPVAALWITSLLIATADTVVLFMLPFPTAGRHMGLGPIAGIATPMLQLLALFGIGGFSPGHMPASFHAVYIAVHYATAIVVSLLIPVFVPFRRAA